MERQPRVPPNRGDFYNLLALLPVEQQALLADLRRYLEADVAPIIAEHWERAEFPAQIVPALAKMNLAGSKFTGYGCAGYGELFHGLLMVELARIDPSLAIFFGGHDGAGHGQHRALRLRGAETALAAADGPDGEDRRVRPHRARRRLRRRPRTATTARRDGDTWVLDGRKKWIGNATWCDLVVVWARDEADGQVKGVRRRDAAPPASPPRRCTARPHSGPCRTP